MTQTSPKTEKQARLLNGTLKINVVKPENIDFQKKSPQKEHEELDYDSRCNQGNSPREKNTVLVEITPSIDRPAFG